MQPNTYPDGFPQNPLEAIEFSYFLSNEEKQEWRDWLSTASGEQQFELVDTLHAMWVENQKSAVPSSFQQTIDQAPPAPIVQPPIPQYPPTSNNEINKNTSIPASIPPTSAVNATSNPASFLDDEDLEDDFPFISSSPAIPEALTEKQASDAVKNFGSKPYSPSPVIQQNNKPQEDNISKFNEKQQKSVPPVPANSQVREDVPANKSQKVNDSEDKAVEPKQFFNIARIRESATRQQLEQLFLDYSKANEASFAEEKRFRESQSKFIDKVMGVVVNFEQVADFFDSVTQKLLEMNDRLVTQVKEFQEMKSKVTTQQGDMSDQIEEIRRDVDRLYREVRDSKADTRRHFDDLSGQMAAFGADAYRQDGILQRLDLILSRLHKAELKIERMDGKDVEKDSTDSTLGSDSSITSDDSYTRRISQRSIPVNPIPKKADDINLPN